MVFAMKTLEALFGFGDAVVGGTLLLDNSLRSSSSSSSSKFSFDFSFSSGDFSILPSTALEVFDKSSTSSTSDGIPVTFLVSMFFEKAFLSCMPVISPQT